MLWRSAQIIDKFEICVYNHNIKVEVQIPLTCCHKNRGFV